MLTTFSVTKIFFFKKVSGSKKQKSTVSEMYFIIPIHNINHLHMISASNLACVC